MNFKIPGKFRGNLLKNSERHVDVPRSYSIETKFGIIFLKFTNKGLISFGFETNYVQIIYSFHYFTTYYNFRI